MCVLSGDPRVRETDRQRRAGRRVGRGCTLGRTGVLWCPRVPPAPRAPPAAGRESQLPALGILSSPRAARLNSASLTEVHLSCPVASKLGSEELGPVMIKPTANGASRRAHTLWWPGAHLNLGTWLAGTCG